MIKSEKKTLCLIITQQQQIRSWLNPSVTGKLNSSYELTIFAPENCKSEANLYKTKICYYSDCNDLTLEKSTWENDLALHFKSASYRRRILSYFSKNGNFKIYFSLFHIKRLYQGRKLILKIVLTRFKKHSLKSEIPTMNEFQIDFGYHNIYLVVCNVSDLRTNSVINSLARNQYNFIQVVENWDNLSSKFCPSMNSQALVTWGTQSSSHAIQIHGYPSNKTFALGSSRIPNSLDIERLVSKFSYKNSSRIKIFYPGCGAEFEDLNYIAQVLDSLKSTSFSKEIEFVFRPHPLSIIRNGENYYSTWPTEIQIDLPTLGSDQNSDWPDLDDFIYKKMLESEFIIGTPSTLLLEAILFNKKIILDMRGSRLDLTSSRSIFSICTHLKEIFQDKNIPRFYSPQEIPSIISKFEINYNLSDLASSLLFNDNQQYIERIIKLVEAEN